MNQESVFNVLKETILEILPDLNDADITITESLKNLGANSIDRMDIIIDTMKKLDLKISMMSFNECKNIENIIEVFLANK